MQTIKAPSVREAKGFDLVVWVDNDGDIVVRGYTPRGVEYLKSVAPGARPHDVIMIVVSPDEFSASVGGLLKIGFKSHNHSVIYPLGEGTLH